MSFKKTALTFFAITILALVLHLIIFPGTMVGGDEGRYIQDALRISGGEIPIVDYTTRTPILLYLMLLSSKIFGVSLLAFRLPVLLFSALTSGAIFLLGKELYSRRMGLISALIYMLAPMVLWSNQLIKSENMVVLFVVFSALLFVKALKNNKLSWFFLSGIPIGVAFVERQSAAAFLVTIALVLAWRIYSDEGHIKAKIRLLFLSGFATFGGFLLGFLPFFLYFFNLNSQSAVELWLSLFLVNAALAPVEPITGFYEFARGWALTFVEAIAIQGWIIYFAATSFITLFVKNTLREKSFGKILTIGIFLILIAPFYIHAGRVLVDGHFAPTSFTLALVGGTFFWIIFVRAFFSREASQRETDNSFSSTLIIFWLLSVFVVYLFYSSGYNREFLAPLSLAAGFVISLFFSQERKDYKGVVIFSLIVLWVTGAYWFSDPRTGGWWWKQQTVAETSNFLRESTVEGDRVFAASSLPVLYAERKVFQNLSPYSIMLAPGENTGWGTQPSPSEILSGLLENPPTYMIYDGRMTRNFLGKNDRLNEFVHQNYSYVKQFGSGHRGDWIEIWRLQDKE